MSSEAQHKDTVITRREFLNAAAIGAAFLSLAAVFAGLFRFLKPKVEYEEATKFKIGTADNFPVGVVSKFDEKGVFVFSSEEGLYAISSVCTHLGCLVALTDTGFACPCHGSEFNKNGKVSGGPAPRGLPWLQISRDVDGSLDVDTAKEVPVGTLFKIA
ncbi:ubiquinol-cytochrome c reductase iron-sulfur subunit [Candidatus Magnetobacterium casense]|uniref:Rieske (2Fe-2S) protein n=1 Tax=Candidatus Magnetobacterium casense TaxID=1455061 RepID=A0ABS6RVB7_9BACT|nr:Rieske (2Fe-2S) protein [Candidatus Magnetobacterium casensis]MBV6340572.1 Rieske (2Fe-2S) protein [Candidatus Magnetobacterium casensis]